jgi:UDP-N-acetylenolpyruvoylglucosamine reductase
MKILGWNDIELNAMGKKRFKYEVTEDECKVSYRNKKFRNSQLVMIDTKFKKSKQTYLQSRADTWAKSVITFETDKPNRLPFVDVGIFDIGEPNQQFSLEIGMACFW